MDKLLDIKDLKVMFSTPSGLLKAVEGVDIEIGRGECCAIVGESGCGKSVTGLAIMRLLSTPPAHFTAKKMTLYGDILGSEKDIKGICSTEIKNDKEVEKLEKSSEFDLLNSTEEQMLNIRGKVVSMVFQDPASALNPVTTIGRQVEEMFIRHNKCDKKAAREAAENMLESVGVSTLRYNQFPHEMSGGMKQRILIAMATACSPKLMIADEPTTALDVTIQAQVLELLQRLKEENNMAILLITHDLGVVSQMASRVYVMYCGKIVECATANDIIKRPLHPYTKGLIKSIPSINSEGKRLAQIPLFVPHPMQKPQGCHFNPRCDFAMEICKKYMPPKKILPNGSMVRCWQYIGDSV